MRVTRPRSSFGWPQAAGAKNINNRNCLRSPDVSMFTRCLDQSLQGRDSESRSSTENQNHRRAVTIAFTAFVIPSEARNLHFAAECRSLASLGMTIHEEGSLPLSRLHHFLDLALDQVALQCADV